jgi:hypothetical protein
MNRPDMFLIICDTVFVVIFSLLGLVSLLTCIFFKRADHLFTVIACIPLNWLFINEIRKEIAKNKN